MDGGKLLFDADGILSDTSALPGIKSVRLNWFGRSIIVDYDTAVWRPEKVNELLSTQDTESLSNIIATLTDEIDLKNENLFA